MPNKPILPQKLFEELDAAYTELSALPEDTEEAVATKKQAMSVIKDMHKMALERYDLPPEVIAPDNILIRAAEVIPAMSYIPGLARTAVGETALALAGKSKGAGERILNAVVPDVPFVGSGPFNKSAPSVGEYTQLMGIEGNGGKPLPYNEYFNPTTRGTLEFMAGMALDPTNFARLFKNGALNKTIEAEKTMTGPELRKKLADEIEKKNNTYGSEKFLRGAANLAIDPTDELASVLYKSRFKEADKAARAAGKQDFSKTFRDEKIKGITQQGIEQGINSKILEKENMLDQLNAGATGTRTMGDLLSPLESKDFNAKLMDANTLDAYGAAKQDVLGTYERELLSNPSAKELLASQQGMAGKLIYDENGQTVNMPNNTKPKYADSTPLTYSVPGSPIDELSGGVTYNAEDLSRKASGHGEKARVLRFFNEPTMFEVQRNAPATIEELQARGAVHNALRGQARDLQLDILDADKRGLGGKAYLANKAEASLYEGAPYTRGKVFEGKYSTPSSRAARFSGGFGNPVSNWVWSAATGMTDAAKLAGAKLLDSPWGLISKDALQSYMAESQGDERMKSPWSIMKFNARDK